MEKISKDNYSYIYVIYVIDSIGDIYVESLWSNKMGADNHLKEKSALLKGNDDLDDYMYLIKKEKLYE